MKAAAKQRKPRQGAAPSGATGHTDIAVKEDRKKPSLRFSFSEGLHSNSEKGDYSWLLSPNKARDISPERCRQQPQEPMLAEATSLQDANSSSDWLVEGESEVRTMQPLKPQYPELPPSKGVGSYIKSARFNAYRSTRPSLLEEMNTSIALGLQRLMRESSSSAQKNMKNAEEQPATDATVEEEPLSIDLILTEMEKLNTYSIAFERYIQEATVFQPILSSIKAQYDKTLGLMTEKMKTCAIYDEMLRSKDNKYETDMNALKASSDARNKHLVSKIKAMEEQIDALDTERRKLELETKKLRETTSFVKQDYDTTKATCLALTANISKIEEDRWKVESSAANYVAEIAGYQTRELKLSEEIDKLEQTIQQKELLQERLIDPEVLVEKEKLIEELAAEKNRIDHTHRQLLIRYTTIKFMIDASLKKFEDEESAGVKEQSRNNTESIVKMLVAELRNLEELDAKKKQFQSMSVTEKLQQLIDSSKYPQIIFEALLDQVALLHEEHRRVTTAQMASSGRDELESAGIDFLALGQPGVTVNEHGEIVEVQPEDAFFDGRGETMDVPVYLRYSGQVRNLHISERTLLILLNEIWEAKQKHQAAQRSDKFASSSRSGRFSSPPRSGPNFGDWDGLGEIPDGIAGGADNTIHSVNIDTSNWGSSSAKITKVASAVATNGTLGPRLSMLPADTDLSTFLDAFLKDKTGDEVRAVELAYNLINALKRFENLADCKIFSAVLDGKICADIWSDLNELLSKLRSSVMKENEIHSRSVEESRYTIEKFMRAVRKIIPHRNEGDTNELLKAATADNEGKRFLNPGFMLFDHYNGMDAPQSEVMRSKFLELFKIQHLEELLSFQNHVIKTLDSICSADGRVASPSAAMPASPLSKPGSAGRRAMFFGAAGVMNMRGATTDAVHVVSIVKLREAYKSADPHITRAQLNIIMARGAACEVEELLIMEAKRSALPYNEFKANLLKELLKKSLPQPEKKKKK